MTEIEGISSQKNQGLKEKTIERNFNEKENSNSFGNVESFNIELNPKNTENKEKEKTMEVVKNWVEKYLNQDVLDEYALSYEKSKKTKEQKRQNKKYLKYLEKAQEELKPKLVELLEEKVQAGELSPIENDQEAILKMIETTLNSDMHANTLLKAMKKQLEKNQMENSVEIKNLSSQESESSQDDKESLPRTDQLADSGKEEEKKETEETEEKFLIDGERENESNKNQSEAPQTEKDFFDIYQKQKGTYLNVVDGSEFRILKYDPVKKEVYINKYQGFIYDKETESWGSAKEKNGELVLNYDDFLELVENYVFDPEEEILDISEKEEQFSRESSNENEKQELSGKEKAVIEIFNKYLEAKKQAIKKEVQKWHKAEEDGYMSTFTCNSVAYDLEVNFLKKELPGKIKSKLEEKHQQFEEVSLDKILNYFQNLTEQKEKARENF